MFQDADENLNFFWSSETGVCVASAMEAKARLGNKDPKTIEAEPLNKSSLLEVRGNLVMSDP